jgi:hypothetical protein
VHLKFIAARAAAVVALSCMASISVTTLVAYADANPSNHGHHYGQLKHQHPPAPQPPPAAPLAPKTNAPPVVPVGSHPNVSITQTIAPPVSSGATLPLPDLGGQDKTPQNVVAATPPVRDPNLWVVEALLPALLIVWLIILASWRALRNRQRAAGGRLA